ncbi:MAG TPA: DUF2793 domain-containing protein [Microvirga sp.]|jgi:hypothetical protein
MSSTPHLALPFIAAAQAQKHVTHNEALAALDALVHLAVKERGRIAPPATPADGERYLVGSGATGAFATHDGKIAFFDAGLWRFLEPRPGFAAYVEAEDRIVVHDGTLWHDLGHYNRDLDAIDRLGIGTAADAVNRFAAKLNAALFTARATGEGGTGDLRFVLNKETAGNVVSQLYQRGFSGRAEAGLIGDDDFRLRVSADGAAWRDALRVERGTGIVSFPCGTAGLAPAVPGVNLLMNGAFLVNQRNFAGGTLTVGAYGYDRWRAASGPLCTISRNADGLVTLVGPIEQMLDLGQAPFLGDRPNFAGQTLSISVEDPSGPIPVQIGTQTGTIPAGAGRRSATLTLGAGETGAIAVRLQPTTATTFRKAKVELGPPSPWTPTPADIELMRCMRHFQALPTALNPRFVCAPVLRIGAATFEVPIAFPAAMRVAPTLASTNPAYAGGAPFNNQFSIYDHAAQAWVTATGAVTVSLPHGATSLGTVLRVQAGTSFSGSVGAPCSLQIGATAQFAFAAEP